MYNSVTITKNERYKPKIIDNWKEDNHKKVFSV